jgi:hypothetical protein
MQNELFYNFIYEILEMERMQESRIPKTLIDHVDFQVLKTAKFIERNKAMNGGYVYDVIPENKTKFIQYYKKLFPNPLSLDKTSFENVRTFGNSKSRSRQNQRIVFLRGTKIIEANAKQINLEEITVNFKLFSFQLNSFKADKICFIENLDCFMVSEKIIPHHFVFMHAYGRIGKELLSKIETDEILFFPDYDYVGLNEYLTVKNSFPNTTLFFPNNYDELFKHHPKSLKTKNEREQQPSPAVLKSTEEVVVKIRCQLLETKHFLEQQAIFL